MMFLVRAFALAATILGSVLTMNEFKKLSSKKDEKVE